jgi:acetyl esterase/lipase
MVGVNIDYRLAPKYPWPAGVKDLASAIGWTKANIARYGGDPNRIVLFGHSAGANHVADYAAHPEVRGAEASSVIGVIMLSPVYSTAPGARPNPYYGQDADLGSAPGQIARLIVSPYEADESHGRGADRGPVPDEEPLSRVCRAEELQSLLRGHGDRHA